MASKLPIEECFRLLDLDQRATFEEVKSSWRLLSQIFHPDKHQHGSKAQELALRKQQSLNQAYDQLTQYFRSQQSNVKNDTDAKSSKSTRSANENANHDAHARSSQQQNYGRTQDQKSSFNDIRAMAQSLTKAPENIDAESLARFTEQAKSGNAEAQYRVGTACEFGFAGNKVDYNNAAFWYERSGNNGNSKALYRLAYLHLYGHGVSSNIFKGIQLLKTAASNGNVDAQLDLGMAFENGAWVTSNIADALKYYRMAAARGNQIAKRKVETLSGKN